MRHKEIHLRNVNEITSHRTVIYFRVRPGLCSGAARMHHVLIRPVRAAGQGEV